MKFGIHLPQAGPAASPESIESSAKHAEALGFDDVWVSDHVAVPKGAKYPPSAYIAEPLVAMTLAAAVTKRVGLGTTVLVLPLRPPVLQAKMLATIDWISGGRVIVGAAGGWLKKEFDALGVPFDDRGPRTDETIDIMRQVWTEDPIDASWPITGVEMVAMRTKPQPKKSIPIWIGGHSEPAYRRAVQKGDGWHGAFQSVEATRAITKRLRAERPEESFTLSMRTRWDALNDDRDEILRDLEGFREAGIQHIVAEPSQRDEESWLRCMDAFAELFELGG